jgi:hypothetical protein|tara:strand:- start:334 stop:567 length:234 start_codon:yes stop_codon:yes gene_type:complete
MKEPIVHIKRYVRTHPAAMINADTSFEITKIEGGVFFEVQNGNSKPRIVSVGDRISMDQAYEISLNSHTVIEPVYPN